MNNQPEKIIVASMNAHTMGQWSRKKEKRRGKKPTIVALSAAVFCLTLSAYALSCDPQAAQSVMSTGFEYDETLGRLQYVSNILPESAMVFLSSDVQMPELIKPTDAAVMHVWSQAEPWIEYMGADSVRACLDGEVMTIVKNRDDRYTVRLMHDSGIESIYSGLAGVRLEEGERVEAGDVLGNASEASFELRQDGLSILPVFAEADGV